MIALGYVLGLLIGICLGMMGAGGAIMTIPVLVYLFEVDTFTATFYSLFIVGITALTGSFGYLKNGLADLKTVFFFGLPSILSVIATTRVILPAIPDVIIQTENFTLQKDLLIMVCFGIIMIISAFAMFRSSKVIHKKEYQEYQRYRYGLIMLQGILVGIVIGFLGAGGGFIIIPALVVLAHLPMKKAVGTSLCIITINCAIGFLAKYNQVTYVDWEFLSVFSGLAIAGIITGMLFSRKLSGEKLKKVFAIFMLIMGGFIIVKESMTKISEKPEKIPSEKVEIPSN